MSTTLPAPKDSATAVATRPASPIVIDAEAARIIQLATDIDADIPPPEAEHHHEGRPLSLAMKLATLAAVVLPFAGLIAAMVLAWGGWFQWWHGVMLFVGYVLTGFGVTMGYHRLFTHRSFSAPKPVAFTLGVLGSMALEGPLTKWVATHRCHHQHSDDEGDPHSPHAFGAGLKNLARGLVHAHTGWIFQPDRNHAPKYAPDLLADPVARTVTRLWWLWVALGLVIPALIGLAITGTLSGALLGLLWGGLARIFVVHHITWSVNSICHVMGSRPFRSHDESRNNAIMGVLALGEGWHNNHHAFPASARHGLKWWQFDATYCAIKAMSWVGLASNIRVPKPERQAALLKTAASEVEGKPASKGH